MLVYKPFVLLTAETENGMQCMYLKQAHSNYQGGIQHMTGNYNGNTGCSKNIMAISTAVFCQTDIRWDETIKVTDTEVLKKCDHKEREHAKGW